MRYVLFILFVPVWACAQTFGPNNPTVSSNITGTGTNAWGNTNNIFSSNNSYSTINTNGTSNILQGTGFGFNLAATDIVKGIQLDIEKTATSLSNVSLIDTWTVGTTKARPSGNNRCMLVIISLENANSRDVTAITYGGRPLTQLAEANQNNSFYARIEAWYLLESEIAAASNTTISVTYGASTLSENFEIISSAFYSNVDQLSPFNDIESASVPGGAATIQFPSTIGTLPGSMSVTGIFSGNPPSPAQATGNANAFTINSGFTETLDYHAANASSSTSGGAMQVAHKSSSATGTEQPSFTFNGTPNRRVMVGFSLRRARQSDNSVRLYKAGTATGNDKAQLLTDWTVNTDTYVSYGGATDLWGTTWSYSDINNSGFGAGISAIVQNATLRVDHMRISIYTYSVLPLELVHFSASLKDQSIVCDWVTASERDLEKFVVERSQDGNTFEAVGQVAAAGNSESTLTYQFTDSKPVNGILYYRLKMVDTDGSFTYSDVVSIPYNEATMASVYPNPATDWTTILVNNGFQEIIITNATGHITDRFEGNSLEEQKTLHIQEMPDGAYFVWIKDSNGNLQVRKLVKTTR